MGSSSGDELSQWDVQSSNGHDERIFVSVRLRPLNDRETARNDVSDWECINNSTIIYKNHIAERSLFPAAYTFGKHLLRLSFWYNSFDFSSPLIILLTLMFREQTECLGATVPRSRCTRKEPKKLPCQLSAA